MTYRAPTRPRPDREPERPRGTVVKRAEPPEEDDKRVARENAAFVLAESRELAAELERERQQFDRILRVVGALVFVVGLALVVLGFGELRLRAASTAGTALVCGPIALAFGGQGATRAELLPTWLKTLYLVGAAVGGVLGAVLLS